jgi:beta-carotene 3-hydroxylase
MDRHFVHYFLIMEFMAWFSHKYIMHGFLWVLHKDHHKKDQSSWFERNDLFLFSTQWSVLHLLSCGGSTIFGQDCP